MKTTTWDLILDPPLDGETNMAVDAELLKSIEKSGETMTVLRFYSWIRPTISLGRNQRREKAVDQEFCRSAGLDVVDRPTGGRAVLHNDEITYSVVSNDTGPFDGASIYDTYRRISEALSIGYRRLGVDTVLAPDTRRLGVAENGTEYPCFVSPSRYELMRDGRKVVGSAQRRLRRSFLQHGSMPISCERELLARATRLDDRSLLDDEMTGIAECLDRRPTPGEITSAFVGAFGEYFEVDFRRLMNSAEIAG